MKTIKISSCRSECHYCKYPAIVMPFCLKLKRTFELHSSSPFPMECPLEDEMSNINDCTFITDDNDFFLEEVGINGHTFTIFTNKPIGEKDMFDIPNYDKLLWVIDTPVQITGSKYRLNVRIVTDNPKDFIAKRLLRQGTIIIIKEYDLVKKYDIIKDYGKEM